jgi:D-glycero-D-manno-heptose 1,7-bisphosphate phosphatase
MEATGGNSLLAVLFDRDGTLIEDVPYNGDPAAVVAMPGAEQALAAVRGRGLLVGVVSNQSGIGRGLISTEQVLAVNARVEELLGPFDAWCFCPHVAQDGCGCRKPAPGLVLEAAALLGVPASRTAVVGDIGADMDAAAAAGALGVLVPTPVTLAEEVRRAPATAADLAGAVGLLLDGPLPVAVA